LFYYQPNRQKRPSDILIVGSQTNGLKMDSVIRTNKIATLDKQLAKGLLGTLSQSEIDELNMQLKILLAL